MSWTSFVLAYLLGGLTFIPLLLLAFYIYVYHTSLPLNPGLAATSRNAPDDSSSLVQVGDEVSSLDNIKDGGDEAKARAGSDPDAAAGYFAVCRDYTPMGINAKPIDRPTPVGSANVVPPSLSVYQTMLRTFFDRKPSTPGPLDGKNGTSQRPKNAGNVFYVVLRHGHLVLFDDEAQLEVRHVISLARHDVSIYAGANAGPIPEGELWIKRNALRLTLRHDLRHDPSVDPATAPDARPTKPFYLFSENCSAKEDFYFSMLRNQRQVFGAEPDAPAIPAPAPLDVHNMLTLVQRLHASQDDEHVHARWLNALLGRVFQAVHDTAEVHRFVRETVTKKLTRIKLPSFLVGLEIRRMEMGSAPPYFSCPRLRELGVEGECVVEADMRYTGDFRIELATTARIELGPHFSREVDLALSVVVRRIEGHVLLKIKTPPSNRVWYAFTAMPRIEMRIEPIVWSRQVTFSLVLRQIETRIKEVMSETVVLPYWDDVPFFNTEHKQWRGGIFRGEDVTEPAVTASATASGSHNGTDKTGALDESKPESKANGDKVDHVKADHVKADHVKVDHAKEVDKSSSEVESKETNEEVGGMVVDGKQAVENQHDDEIKFGDTKAGGGKRSDDNRIPDLVGTKTDQTGGIDTKELKGLEKSHSLPNIEMNIEMPTSTQSSTSTLQPGGSDKANPKSAAGEDQAAETVETDALANNNNNTLAHVLDESDSSSVLDKPDNDNVNVLGKSDKDKLMPPNNASVPSLRSPEPATTTNDLEQSNIPSSLEHIDDIKTHTAEPAVTRSNELFKSVATSSDEDVVTPAKPVVVPTAGRSVSHHHLQRGDGEGGLEAESAPDMGRRLNTSVSSESLTRPAEASGSGSKAGSSMRSPTGSVGRSFFSRRERELQAVASRPGTSQGAGSSFFKSFNQGGGQSGGQSGGVGVNTTNSPNGADSDSTTNHTQKRNTLAAVQNAAAQARQWGWNALQRHKDQQAARAGGSSGEPSGPGLGGSTVDLSQPMGRGRPLPPPGMPLPGPDNGSSTIAARRRTMAPPKASGLETGGGAGRRWGLGRAKADPESSTSAQTPLQRRRLMRGGRVRSESFDNVSLLVVAAPEDSAPSSPSSATSATSATDREAAAMYKSQTKKTEANATPRLPALNIAHAADEDDGYIEWFHDPITGHVDDGDD